MENLSKKRDLKILAIDTSCDETAVAVLRNDCVISNVVFSQIKLHQEWGGVVPGIAKRAHKENIDKCIELALKRANLYTPKSLDIIAVTYGPGLAIALEVGIEKAKQLAKEYKKALIGVNHIEAHLLSPLLKNSKKKYYHLPLRKFKKKLKFPIIGMVVSGGHTEIILVKKIGDYEILGQTLDDAAGEAFDKIARMLGLGYPGGKVIEEFAKNGDPNKYSLPRPMIKRPGYDFSYSGLKTACLYNLNDLKEKLKDNFHSIIPDYCASVQEAIIDSLLIRLKKAVKDYKPYLILVGGGVSANLRLRSKFRKVFLKEMNIPIFFPANKFCMDNAAMIGLVAYFKAKRNEFVKNIENFDRVPQLKIHEKKFF